jgi:hypothetical protein
VVGDAATRTAFGLTGPVERHITRTVLDEVAAKSLDDNPPLRGLLAPVTNDNAVSPVSRRYEKKIGGMPRPTATVSMEDSASPSALRHFEIEAAP